MKDNINSIKYLVALKKTEAPEDGNILTFDERDDESGITCYNVCLMTANCPDTYLQNVISADGYKILNVKVGPSYAKKQFPKLPNGMNGIEVDEIDFVVGCTARDEKLGFPRQTELLQGIMNK